MASGFAPFERRSWSAQLRRVEVEKGAAALEKKGAALEKKAAALEKEAAQEKGASLGVGGRMTVGSAPPSWWSFREGVLGGEARLSSGFDPRQRWSFKSREHGEAGGRDLLPCASETEALGEEGPMHSGFGLAAALGELDPMADVFDLQQCSLKLVGVTGERDPVKGFSAESKDKADEVVEAGCIEGDKPGEVMAVADGDEAPAARKGLTPLPKEEVEWVLSWKRGHLTSGYATLEGIEAFEALNDSCDEYQAWMLAEYNANGGVVYVDDEFLKERAEYRQSLKDFLNEIQDEDDDIDFTGWTFSDLRSDFYDDESEEEEEEGEGEEEAAQELNTN